MRPGAVIRSNTVSVMYWLTFYFLRGCSVNDLVGLV